MKVPINKTYQQNNQKLIPVTSRKAIITAVYPSSCTVDIYFIGNNQTVIRNIPVASNTDISTIAQGDRCKVDLFDETNPNDMVMSYTYGKPQKKRVSSGTAVVPFTGITIPHGLGATPDLVSIIPNAGGAVFQTSPPDANNIYLQYFSGSGSLSTNWYALKL